MKKILFYLASAMIFTATFPACTAEIMILPSGVILDQNAITISPGESLTLTAELFPDDAAIKTVTWNSSNIAVATVVNGIVTAKEEGKAIITVTTNSGQKMSACEVTVAYPVSGVVLDKGSVLLPLGQNLSLTATVMPGDAPDKTITWNSSDPAIATVANGLVTAKAPGTAIISVITGVGNRIARTTVKVLPENANMITMILQPFEFVSLIISGSGSIDIDWDDYEIESYSFFPLNYNHFYLNNYPIPRTVTIVADNISRLDCNSLELKSLDVSKCATLTSLNCSNNQLTGLDISNNTALRILDCSKNRLTDLDVSNNSALIELNCSVNQLTTLDVSNITTLKNLNCAVNQLSYLNVSNTALTELICYNNQLISLDVSNKIALIELNCSRNILTDLITGANSALAKLNCSNNELPVHVLDKLFDRLPVMPGGLIDFANNPGTSGCNKSIAEDKGWLLPKQMFLTLEDSGLIYIRLTGYGMVEIDWGDGSPITSVQIAWSSTEFSHTFVDITSCTITITGTHIANLYCNMCRITRLDVSNNPALAYLWCTSNRLTDLDLSNNTALVELGCSDNQIKHLDVSANTVLTGLYCGNNQLTGLDVSGNLWLKYLSIENNQLSSVDVSQNSALTNFYCAYNQLTSLDVSNNLLLTFLYCVSNQLSTEALNALFTTLHTNYVNGGYKWITINDNPGANTCNRNIATGKGWTVN